jgi:transcriptional regulator with XRE-family HTH domain
MSKLKEFREAKGLSQEAFAKAIGYTLSMTAKVESGAAKASRNFMEKVKKAFPEVDINNIFFAN